MKFTKALRYDVNVICLSPLHTGGANGSTSSVLHSGDGRPILQGASLAGALRGWQENADLFGIGQRESSLIVSDIVFDGEEIASRTRLRLNAKTGTAADGGVFLLNALAAGTTGSFTLIWRGENGVQQAKEAIEVYLAALDRGEISLGAQKANGFGRVRVQACRREYDLKIPEDREAWLAEEKAAEPVGLSGSSGKYVLFQVQARTPAMLIQARSGRGYGEDGVKVVHYRDNDRKDGDFVVPGSSIKGAIRGQILRFAPYFGAEDTVEQLFGRRSGKNGLAGKLRFGDGRYEEPRESERICRIRINRFTGSVMNTGLFSQKNVSGTLHWQIAVPKEEKLGCGLILYALRDLGLGLYTLGSGSAVGVGRIESLEVHISAPDGSGKMCCQEDKVTFEDPDGLISGWQKALGGAAK